MRALPEQLTSNENTNSVSATETKGNWKAHETIRPLAEEEKGWELTGEIWRWFWLKDKLQVKSGWLLEARTMCSADPSCIIWQLLFIVFLSDGHTG